MNVHNQDVRGINVDAQTRCAHYHSPVDIVAIKMACCNTYYACKDCHIALADHEIKLWPQSTWNTKAILCGSCGEELSIHQYMHSNNQCTHCKAAFNPGCRNHYRFYFATEDTNG